RGRYFPRPQLRPDVAEEFRIGPQRRHMTSPLESLENSASSVSTFSSTPQTGAPTFTASRTSAASSESVPGKTISASKPASFTSLTPGRPASHAPNANPAAASLMRSEEHTSELQSLRHLVCRLLLEKKKPS